MAVRKWLWLGATFGAMICAATVASAPGALAAPITTIGFAVNGTCEAGTCPAMPLAVGGSASLPFTFDTAVNGDDFQITGTPGSSNPNGANFGAGTPFSIQYLGDGTGGASQADTLTANAYRAYTSNVTSVGVTALQSVGFSSAIAAGSTAQTSVALNGTNVAAFGPFSSSTAKSFSQVQSYSLGISTGTLTQDNTYTTTFAAGSPVGSYVTYGTAPAPPLPNPVLLPAPSILTLANLANNVYSGESGFTDPNISETFTAFSATGNESGSGPFAVAYQTSNDSQIVISIRGTDCPTQPVNCVKNLLSDLSFAKGSTIASPALLSEISQVSQFVHQIEQTNPNANITLTGHSLGGAVSQVIGQASGINTVVFNAPGASAVYQSLLNNPLAGLTNFVVQQGQTTPYSSTNYRIYGDQVSEAGTSIGTQITLQDPAYTTFAPNNNTPTAQDFVDAEYEFGVLHSMNTVLAQIADGAPQVSSTGQPNDVQLFQDYFLAAGTIVANGAQQFYKNIAIPSCTQNGFCTMGSPVYQGIVDPAKGTEFILTEDVGSPDFTSIYLPSFPGVNSYGLSYEIGNVWSTSQNIQPSSEFDFNRGVDGIEFSPLDVDGNAVSITGGFLFDVGFASDGKFSGELLINQETEVPEPSTVMVVLPATLVLITYRLKFRDLIYVVGYIYNLLSRRSSKANHSI